MQAKLGVEAVDWLLYVSDCGFVPPALLRLWPLSGAGAEFTFPCFPMQSMGGPGRRR